ncbi:NAD-dependent epimerase/dehydratase family protein [Sphingomonas astaxanthinifaciens]|uniref:NAD-dependent epimerase n=1 Tax=Sphingomonas astaxanthinifaciens DSM 22298 TaxID=1123267 RepID=A0ABQ5Z6G0_9SPHN|nr:NAD-dependent epimerase/dehydratase family protein [Sphingomonas astaxanthinifaciens]GLR46966.1 NAD-dependent epimerase [Sphingomonas astaxanthinifaciens DSM 22298]
MAILVTGCAGFIGMHTALALLARGEEVVGIDNLNAYYDPALKQARLAELARFDGFAFRQADLADMEALRGAVAAANVDRIVHLGAQAGVRYSFSHPADYIRSNLVGHANILELARALEVRHLVYASSSSVYGGGTTLPMSLDQRADRPLSLYAATKRADELMSESYAHLFAIPQTGLRFFTVYGPWGRPDMAVWLFTDAILAGRPIRLFNEGRMKRDFTFVDDIVAGVLLALDRPPAADGSAKPGGSHGPHALYNIGNHRSEELRRLVAVIEQATGREAVVEFAPLQPGDMVDTYADIDDLARDTGFAPRTTLDTGIPRFVDWFEGWRQR